MKKKLESITHHRKHTVQTSDTFKAWIHDLSDGWPFPVPQHASRHSLVLFVSEGDAIYHSHTKLCQCPNIHHSDSLY